jgi:hypothetical protein
VKWKSDDGLFAMVQQELFTCVVGDVMDKMQLTHQYLPPAIRLLRSDNGTFLGLCQRGGFDHPLCVFRDQRTNPGANHPVLDITARRSDAGTSSIDIASER